MKQRRVFLVGLLLMTALAFVCVGCATTEQSNQQKNSNNTTILDPENPVQVEFWTYYNGAQQQAFESLVTSFNETRGKELGVVVSTSSQGGVNELADAVTASAQEQVGAEPMPNAFLSYADTASVIDGFGRVANLSSYLSEAERDEFVASFIEEGDFNGTGEVKVFPVAKSTETLQINATDWQPFADATGSSLDELATIEGITEVSGRYFEWTDAQTPEVAGDGKPFFGRDAIANYFITGTRQLGEDLLEVEAGAATINANRDALHKLWSNFYTPLVKGWFSSEGKFRSDAVKTGNLICYVGSSSSVVYFPSTVTVDDQTSYPIELAALPAPVFEGDTPCAAQQGAGFVVAKTDEQREAASVEFLKWFTATEQNTAFAVDAGYMPVKKEALTVENITAVAQAGEKPSENYLINLPATLDTIERGVYATQPFEGGVEVRAILEHHLLDRALDARAAVLAETQAGVPLGEAVAPYVNEAEFEAWLSDFSLKLNAASGSPAAGQ